MKIKTVVNGNLKENCYILIKGKDCLVVDPGNEYPKIKKAIGDLNVLGILVTHSHYDHMGVMFDIIEDYNVKVHRLENLKEKEYKMNDFIFNVIYTPGHTEDSITFLFKEDKIMFTGDFIFKNDIGRWDLPTGDYKETCKSIDKIKKYDDDITIYPGHGSTTTLKEEKEKNKYFLERN